MSNPFVPYTVVLISLAFAVMMGVGVGLAVDGPQEVDEAYNGTDQTMQNVSDDLEGNVSDSVQSIVIQSTEAAVDGSKVVAYLTAWYLQAVQTPVGKAVYAATVLPSVVWISLELH